MKKYLPNLEEIVYCYPTKYEHGFIEEEIDELLAFYNIEKKDFSDKHGCNTCMIMDSEIINYHIDVYTTIKCCLEKRDRTLAEFD